MVSGHLGSPTVNNGVIAEEEDSSVTSLERSIDLVLDTLYISGMTLCKEGKRLTRVGTLLSLDDEVPELSVFIASNDDNPVLLHVERGRGELDGFAD